MFKKILYATNLRECEKSDINSCGFCLDSFKKVGAQKVHLLHVLDSSRDFDEQDKKNREQELERLAEVFRNRGWEVKVDLKEGVPFDTIITTALEEDVSILSMGSGRGSRIKRNLLGETAYRVLQMCPLPVFICKHVGEQRDVMSNILFGEDFSNSSHEAFKFLRKICSERKGSDLEATLLHVHEQSNLEMLLKVASMEKINRIEKSEKERLEELAELLSADMKIRPCVDIRRGNQVKEFLNAIKDNGSLMVLIGAQGLRWSEQYRIGETAFRIAEESPVPVLVIPLDKMKYPF